MPLPTPFFPALCLDLERSDASQHSPFVVVARLVVRSALSVCDAFTGELCFLSVPSPVLTHRTFPQVVLRAQS